MVSDREFDAARERWREDCLAEFNAKYADVFGEKHLATDELGPDCVEFAETGDAYPHGIGGTAHVRKAVTPWRESPHYVET